MDLQDGKRMFGGIKSKLGFGSKNKVEDYDDAYYDDYDDSYRDQGGYDDYDDYDSAEGSYGRGSSYSTREGSRSGYSTRPSYRSSSSGVSAREVGAPPRLVSIEDVRANTRIPSTLNRDPLPSRQTTSAQPAAGSFRGARTMVDSSLPPQMTPEGTAAQAIAASGRRSSEGLDLLFAPTADEASRDKVETTSYGVQSSAGSSARPAFDPFESFSGSSNVGYSASRETTVLSPQDYGEVEQVSRALKAGDAVILCLAAVPDSLAKRILDFSFGVASALDANVECIADKVFAVTRGNELSGAERSNLRARGVI